MDDDVWRAIEEVINRYEPDISHVRQVCRLSLLLFGQLYGIHHLKESDRDLLKAAALLHDIGWSLPNIPHHKASRDLILKDQSIPFSSHERFLIAEISRYHRKAHPSDKHPGFASLGPEDKKKVYMLAAILRIADALDRSHLSLIEELSCEVSKENLTIICKSRNVLMAEKNVIKNKSSLFTELTGLQVIVV